jgi:hypothetical protein
VECARLLLDRGVDVVNVSSWLVVHACRVAGALCAVWRALAHVCVCARVCKGYWVCVRMLGGFALKHDIDAGCSGALRSVTHVMQSCGRLRCAEGRCDGTSLCQ